MKRYTFIDSIDLHLKAIDDKKFYWGIENYSEEVMFKEIPEYLYRAIMKFNQSEKK